MEVIQVPDRPASEGFYVVAGRLLFLENRNLQLRNLVELLFAGWQLTPVTSPDGSPDIRINFCCVDRLPRVPDKFNQFEIANGGQCYTKDSELYLLVGQSLVHLKQSDSVVVDVWLAELPGPGDPRLATVTSFAVCAALRRFGIFEMHSAGLLNPESDRAVLIVGPSGSGKSTLSLQLALSGWPYLSDDELLLSLVDGVVEARGFRSFFAVNQEHANSKHCFEPDITLGLERALQATPGVLLFTSLNGRPDSEIRRLTQADGMMRLIRSCPWATYDTSIAGENLRVLSALARQAVAFELSAGSDLLQPGRAAQLLSELR